MRSTRFSARWIVGASLLCLLAYSVSPCYCRADEPVIKVKEDAARLMIRIAEAAQKLPDWDKVVDGATRMEGLFPLYYNQKEQKLFMEIRQDQYDKELILPIAIARGAGLMYLGGETLNFGDQWLISFRRAGDRLLVTRHNVRVRAEAGSPQADAVKVSYTDSVIKALPIKSEKHGGALVLIDLADLFMTDLADIGVYPDVSAEHLGQGQGVPQQRRDRGQPGLLDEQPLVLLAVQRRLDRGPAGTQIVVHYGLSLLPASGGYRPRLADDRVGHFLSVIRDFSEDVRDTPKVRYLTRWHLEKAKPAAEKSPPKQPIIFWIERTVPREYRQYVREGILEWNKAFEKVGFIDAIQVRDQQADDEFDPEDIRYNIFRWITTSAGFAMGPSRTNPQHGRNSRCQHHLRRRDDPLLAAGIHRNPRHSGRDGDAAGRPAAGVLPALRRQPAGLRRGPADDRPHARRSSRRAAGTAGAAAAAGRRRTAGAAMLLPLPDGAGHAAAASGRRRRFGRAGRARSGRQGARKTHRPGDQGSGHARGGPYARPAAQFQGQHRPVARGGQQSRDYREKGNSGSVMDYLPANIAPKGEKQGDYFSPTIGPYDYWAIEYAYKPIEGNEAAELAKIAARAAEPDLTFATDEDVWLNPDPRINVFDLGDPLDYAKSRVKLVRVSLDDLQNRVVAKGEGWQRARRAFSVLIGELFEATWLSLNYIGGEYTCRDHREDPNARPPMKPIDVAKQREAIRLLQDEILSARAFQFKPELLRYLAPDQWRDNRYFFFTGGGYQYPVLEEVGWMQQMVVSHLLDAETLRSLEEIALHAEPGQEVLALPEVFNALTDSIWSELPASEADAKKDQKLALSTIRRNLEREHVSRLSRLVLGPRRDGLMGLFILLFEDFRPAPPDARSLARQHLHQIDDRIQRVLKAKGQIQIDPQTLAHLEQLHDQIQKVFKASMQVNEQ